MKIIQIVCLSVALTFTFSVKAEGIIFRRVSNWNHLLKEAKEKNMYIFVDCYATWCLPCKKMDKEVFSQNSVGNFVNQRFICIKLQMDTTDSDSQEIKKSYELSHFIMTKYSSNMYPDYMVFDTSGKLIHRFIGSMKANDFLMNIENALEKNKQSLDPEQEYHRLQKKLTVNPDNLELLKSLTYLALTYHDLAMASNYSKRYLSLQHYVLSKKNMKFIFETVQNTSDTGFSIMIKHLEEFKTEFGEEPFYAGLQIKICMDEVLPKVSIGQTKKQWDSIEINLQEKYPNAVAATAVAQAKYFYYSFNKDWMSFALAIDEYAGMPYSLAIKLDDFAKAILLQCSDSLIINHALGWSRASFQKDQNPLYLSTYAQLLYKTGFQKEALKYQINAMKLAQKQNLSRGWGVGLKEKMTKGESLF